MNLFHKLSFQFVALLFTVSFVVFVNFTLVKGTPIPMPTPTVTAEEEKVVQFNKPGPILQIMVARQGKTDLPIFNVPELQDSDTLRISPKFADISSGRWLLYVAHITKRFGDTTVVWEFNNPIELWKTSRIGGVDVNNWERTYDVKIRAGAQPIVFLAPKGFLGESTIKKTVTDNKSKFYSESVGSRGITNVLSDLTIQQSNLDLFLTGLKKIPEDSPVTFKNRAAKIAKLYGFELNEKCFAEKTQGQIAKCLSTNVVAQFGSVPKFIQDASGNTIAVTLGETAANLIPPQYAAFVKLAIELYFLAKSFRVNYEFLPSLPVRIGESNDVELRLNKDAVFGGVKSVVMFIPPTRGVNSTPAPIFSINQATFPACTGISKSSVPIEKPQALIQSEYANSFALSFSSDSGKQDNVPLTVNREIGAFEFDSNQIDRSLLNNSNLVTGTINGQWGLSPLTPIQFKLTKQQTTSWEISTDDQKNFEKGKKFTVALNSPAAGCVQKVVLRDRDDSPYEAELKYQYTNPISVLATFDLSKDEVVAGEGKLQISSLVENETVTTEIGTLVLRPLSKELPQIELHTADNMLRVLGADADLVSIVKIGGLTFVRKEPTDANFREGWTNDGQFLFEQNNQKVPNGLVRERATIIYDKERNRKMDVVINKIVRPSITVSSPEITVSRTSPFRDIDVRQIVPH